MSELRKIEPERVFYYFGEICKIPHGSCNMKQISAYCENFAKEHSLRCVRDEANNVVIFKDATKGYENSEPIILQGHIDMVCQKEEGCEIDFLNDGIEAYVDGDFVTAKGTTLGADNGIAVAMILAILESNEYSHPPIEAVFTTDEEIGMVGAFALDTGILKGRRMINIDSEEDDTVTVSCAGGSDFTVTIPFEKVKKAGYVIDVTLKGLQGGHSGVEIHKGRVNANILAGRFLNHLALENVDYNLISINGGDKPNAITNLCRIEFLVEDKDVFEEKVKNYLDMIKVEISAREPDFEYTSECIEDGHFYVLPNKAKADVVFALSTSPDGVIDMSAEIDGLVETSLNMGILKTEEDSVYIHYSFRSNKATAIQALKERMYSLYSPIQCEINTFGDYPSWEYNAESKIKDLYIECYKEHYGKLPKIEAIHAGLECGVFASKIKDFDCISIGPDMFDVHTFKERLSISSTQNIFRVLLNTLEKCK